MKVHIRKASIKDAEAISNIWKVICAERVYSAVKQPFTTLQEGEYIAKLSDRELISIAEIENQIIGFQTLDQWAKYIDSFDHVGILGTFILPKWRKKGIGRKLSRFTLDFAKFCNYEKFVIYVRASNIIAQNFYRNLGFTTKGILTNQVKINGVYDDEIFMEFFLV